MADSMDAQTYPVINTILLLFFALTVFAVSTIFLFNLGIYLCYTEPLSSCNSPLSYNKSLIPHSNNLALTTTTNLATISTTSTATRGTRGSPYATSVVRTRYSRAGFATFSTASSRLPSNASSPFSSSTAVNEAAIQIIKEMDIPDSIRVSALRTGENLAIADSERKEEKGFNKQKRTTMLSVKRADGRPVYEPKPVKITVERLVRKPRTVGWLVRRRALEILRWKDLKEGDKSDILAQKKPQSGAGRAVEVGNVDLVVEKQGEGKREEFEAMGGMRAVAAGKKTAMGGLRKCRVAREFEVVVLWMIHCESEF
ncbi:hypothetical protein P154DRAFT_623982 [Amniculicola lignicola CBS 123094]|uniref:Uncharacterized protein n=1 Tax=Amniculicola lignicola CBS 123094 TaxID=1392246 RepID=A0A6A5W0E5_9PLEO|nr:hypothetical protein P154DRAFT_623982 [Amniculicola lignicola CBS 123094]